MQAQDDDVSPSAGSKQLNSKEALVGAALPASQILAFGKPMATNFCGPLPAPSAAAGTALLTTCRNLARYTALVCAATTSTPDICSFMMAAVERLRTGFHLSLASPAPSVTASSASARAARAASPPPPLRTLRTHSSSSVSLLHRADNLRGPEQLGVWHRASLLYCVQPVQKAAAVPGSTHGRKAL